MYFLLSVFSPEMKNWSFILLIFLVYQIPNIKITALCNSCKVPIVKSIDPFAMSIMAAEISPIYRGVGIYSENNGDNPRIQTVN